VSAAFGTLVTGFEAVLGEAAPLLGGMGTPVGAEVALVGVFIRQLTEQLEEETEGAADGFHITCRQFSILKRGRRCPW
jgi:hypothetical protein